MNWGVIEPEFKKGDRIRPSERFRKIFPLRGKRRGSPPIVEGTVVGFSRDVNCYRIIWDGRKHYETIHGSYLEESQIEEPANAGDEMTAASDGVCLTPHKINQESDNG